MARVSASCSCRAVRCSIDHDIQTLVNCHCTDCRKMNGSAFSSMAVSPTSAVEITDGKEHLARYAMSPAVTKHFCKLCGTPMFNTNEQLPGLSMFFLGAIDQDRDLAPSFNVFCRSKLSWVDHVAGLKSFSGNLEQ